jgi:hypothetical protein
MLNFKPGNFIEHCLRAMVPSLPCAPHLKSLLRILSLAVIGFTGLPAVAEECETATAVMAELEGDPMFARPYIDLDEWRAEPVRHRYVHGGFEDTDTRFSFYLPPTEQYEGRFFQYITPVPKYRRYRRPHLH